MVPVTRSLSAILVKKSGCSWKLDGAGVKAVKFFHRHVVLRTNSERYLTARVRVLVYRIHTGAACSQSKSESTLPLWFVRWAAGFVPLRFYWLLPPTKVPRRQEVEWVVIEEPEAGLHPNAISAVLLLILDLLARGYRVCLSTHSPHVLMVGVRVMGV
jgi:hypothetical protein